GFAHFDGGTTELARQEDGVASFFQEGPSCHLFANAKTLGATNQNHFSPFWVRYGRASVRHARSLRTVSSSSARRRAISPKAPRRMSAYPATLRFSGSGEFICSTMRGFTLSSPPAARAARAW